MDSPAPQRRALKRSASTASLLLTPPRTYRRAGRGRSRGSCDSSSDHGGSDNALSTDDEGGAHEKDQGRHKKRRLERSAQDDGDEEAKFWGGGETSKLDEPTKLSTSSRPTRPLLYRRFKSQSVTSTVSSEQGLVSPPPSHRKTGNVPAAPLPTSPSPATTASLPVTPQPKRKRQTSGSDSDVLVLRDSPSNPFIATPAGEQDAVESADALPQEAQSPTPMYDKPTVTYVFRGVRRVYQNPSFNHAQNRPLSPPPNSKLPVEDPAFSPDPTCKPRLLFPEAHKKRKAKHSPPAQSSSKRSNRDWDSDSEPETVETKLGQGRMKQPKLSRPMTLEAELRRAAAKLKPKAQPQATDDDPFC